MTKKLFFYTLFATLFIFTSPTSNATPARDFKVNTEKFSVEVPEKWTALEKILGTPVALVSKQGKAGKRAVIEIVPYGMTDEKNYFKNLKKDPEQYYEQKEDWLARVDGESISFDAFQEEKINGNTLYSIGVTYSLGEIAGDFHEKSYYLLTQDKKIFFIKSLIPQDLEVEQEALVNKTVRSIASIKQ